MNFPRVIVAGDMNAHSPMWDGRAAKRQNDAFWEQLIVTYGLTIHNSEEATRSGANAVCHSIIDLTLSKGDVDLQWSVSHEDNSAGLDHEILVWEVVEEGWREPISRVGPAGIQADGRDAGRAGEEEGNQSRGEEDVGGRGSPDGPAADTKGGGPMDHGHGGQYPGPIRQTTEGVYAVKEMVERRDRGAGKGAGKGEASRPEPPDRCHQGRATRPPEGHQDGEEGLLEQLPGEREQRRRVDGGKVHKPPARRQCQAPDQRRLHRHHPGG